MGFRFATIILLSALSAASFAAPKKKKALPDCGFLWSEAASRLELARERPQLSLFRNDGWRAENWLALAVNGLAYFSINERFHSGLPGLYIEVNRVEERQFLESDMMGKARRYLPGMQSRAVDRLNPVEYTRLRNNALEDVSLARMSYVLRREDFGRGLIDGMDATALVHLLRSTYLRAVYNGHTIGVLRLIEIFREKGWEHSADSPLRVSPDHLWEFLRDPQAFYREPGFVEDGAQLPGEVFTGRPTPMNWYSLNGRPHSGPYVAKKAEPGIFMVAKKIPGVEDPKLSRKIRAWAFLELVSHMMHRFLQAPRGMPSDFVLKGSVMSTFGTDHSKPIYGPLGIRSIDEGNPVRVDGGAWERLIGTPADLSKGLKSLSETRPGIDGGLVDQLDHSFRDFFGPEWDRP